MPLLLNFKTETADDNKSFDFFDLTGTGTTGYGGSNPVIGDFTSSEIILLLPNSTSPKHITTTFPTLPNINNIPFNITNVMAGLSLNDRLTDGLWEITYKLFINTTEYTRTLLFAFTRGIECCIDQKIVELECGECEKMTKLTDAKTMLKNLCFAAKCGKREKAKKILLFLQEFCKVNNCLTC